MTDAHKPRLTFRKRSRLLKRDEFQRVFDHGRRMSAGCLTARVVANDKGRPRMAFVTPRQLGAHPKRNRVRRVMREAYRINQRLLTAGVDVVVLPTRGWTDYRLEAAEPAMQALLRRIETQYGPADPGPRKPQDA